MPKKHEKNKFSINGRGNVSESGKRRGAFQVSITPAYFNHRLLEVDQVKGIISREAQQKAELAKAVD